ncbi:hypothetical protein MNV49_002800 [Pseudohyphozyma bogoriensis]|nr:hypothetical protein MNV49_002800 [Pseudohyphozyma bogoriensis]
MASELPEPAPSTPPEDGSPDVSDVEDAGAEQSGPAKAKKKKKRKTPAQKRAAALEREKLNNPAPPPAPVLKISRNKHMKYISSYHGPWLQLPHEVLDSLLHVNCDPEALPTVRGLMEAKSTSSAYDRTARLRGLPAPPSDPLLTYNYPGDEEDRLPPPIDPAVFRGVAAIRRLVDDAADLAVRAASGMSAAALGALNMGSGMGNGPLGNDGTQGGRNVPMSPIRQHRLRLLAVSKLADAYRIDEIAASVAVMQGATGLDDLAQRVMRHEPDSADAQYVNFFHEKIPSRTLALSTDTLLLDQLIAKNPNKLEYYRTRGIVHGFKQDYQAAIRNYTDALIQAKNVRKAKMFHSNESGNKGGKKKGKGGKSSSKDKERAPDASASVPAREEATAMGKEPGDDIERQMLFHRGMAHFHYACKLIEDAVLDIEGIEKPQGGLSNEGGELTLRNVGIVLKDENAGLFGCASPKVQDKYREVLGDPALKEKVTTLLRKSIRDQERFLSYFAIWEAPSNSILEDEKRHHNPRATDKPLTFRGRRLIHHRSLSNRTRHFDARRPEVRNGTAPNEAALLTTYHPLLIEAHFSVLLNHLLLGDFAALVGQHYKIARLMDYLEGYPVFLPARSLNQSEYAELLERLATTWLKKREDGGVPAPEGTEEDVAKEGDLKSLHHILSFFTEDFVAAFVAAAEAADKEAKDEAKAKASSNSILALLDSGAGKETKGTWREEREKAEAERRKIDPSYATYNTARAEVALAWLTAVILPEKEAEEREERGKGKEKVAGKGKGKGPAASDESEADDRGVSRSNGSGSTSRAGPVNGDSE